MGDSPYSYAGFQDPFYRSRVRHQSYAQTRYYQDHYSRCDYYSYHSQEYDCSPLRCNYPAPPPKTSYNQYSQYTSRFDEPYGERAQRIWEDENFELVEKVKMEMEEVWKRIEDEEDEEWSGEKRVESVEALVEDFIEKETDDLELKKPRWVVMWEKYLGLHAKYFQDTPLSDEQRKIWFEKEANAIYEETNLEYEFEEDYPTVEDKSNEKLDELSTGLEDLESITQTNGNEGGTFITIDLTTPPLLDLLDKSVVGHIDYVDVHDELSFVKPLHSYLDLDIGLSFKSLNVIHDYVPTFLYLSRALSHMLFIFYLKVCLSSFDLFKETQRLALLWYNYP